jgi:hypothetical protein
VQQFKCGEQQALQLGIILDEGDHWLLGDFFKKVSIGMRISYVVAPQDFNPREQADGAASPQFVQAASPIRPSCWRERAGDFQFDELKADTKTALRPVFEDMKSNLTWQNAAMYEKAFFVKEYCNDCITVPNQNPPPDKEPRSSERYAHVIPIVSVEQEIPRDTRMKDIAHRKYTRMKNDPQTGVPGPVDVSFFEDQYLKRLTGEDGYPSLRSQMKETDEFKALFKYMFPIDRMLSLTNVYSSTYLSTFKDLDKLFDGTKINLKRLFFACLGSGNQKADECGPNNLDLQLSLLNGMDIEGLAFTLIRMAIKAAFMVFKHYTEIADPNIGISKKIVDAIHIVNVLIAQAQVMANQAQQVGASVGQMAEDLSNLGDSCKTNLPGQPPDDWFDPVEENFIPEPQIFFISLALLPITIIPLLWPGVPITPAGMAYWFLDAKPYDVIPGPNWFQDLKWPSKLIGEKKSDEDKLSDSSACPDINIGVPALGPTEE